MANQIKVATLRSVLGKRRKNVATTMNTFDDLPLRRWFLPFLQRPISLNRSAQCRRKVPITLSRFPVADYSSNRRRSLYVLSILPAQSLFFFPPPSPSAECHTKIYDTIKRYCGNFYGGRHSVKTIEMTIALIGRGVLRSYWQTSWFDNTNNGVVKGRCEREVYFYFAQCVKRWTSYFSVRSVRASASYENQVAGQFLFYLLSALQCTNFSGAGST
jgi:hypothetical protein